MKKTHDSAERKGSRLPLIRLFLLCAALSLTGARGAWATHISHFSGKIFYIKAGETSWQSAPKGMALVPGDKVRADEGSSATITFDDGSRVEIGSNGLFAIKEADKKTMSMVLGLGSLRAWVAKNVGRSFQVRTPTAVCSVRGTEFSVDVNQQGHTGVEMFTGSLVVEDTQGNSAMLDASDPNRSSIRVTDKGLSSNQGASGQTAKQDRGKDLFKREVGLEMSKDAVQAAAALEAKNAIYQQGKAIIDVTGNRVRIEEYIIRSQPNQFKLVVLNDRADRFDYFYYKGTFNQTLPADISVALRQLPGCIGVACSYFLTDYETGRSNTIDNMLEVAAGGHLVDVNNNGVADDAVTAAYDPAKSQFVSVPVLNPGANDPARNQPFFRSLFNTNSLTFNGVFHSGWTPSAAAIAAGGNIRNMSGDISLNLVTSVQTAPDCGPPNCTYTEPGVLHQVVYASNGAGTIWEKYDNYIISDEGKIANMADFAGITSGTQYKSTLLNWNYQTIVTASEFNGRKIDLAVEPKIFIQSGLIP